MTEFDLRSPTTRILECAKCDQLVAGEPSGRRVELRCGYCSVDDVRELTGTLAVDEGLSAYRGKQRDGRGRIINADLSTPPKGLAVRMSVAGAREQWLSAKRALAADVSNDARVDLEFRILYVGASLANGYLASHEVVRARAVLETLLELLGTPAYRAIALARLARVAAICDAPDLADRWLDAAPRGLRVAEVTSELRVAQAFVARARGDAKEVLVATGQQDTAHEFLGPTRAVAVALRVDAHEKLGEKKLAFLVYREGLRAAKGLARAARTYDLAPVTRTKAMWWGIAVLVAIATMLASLSVIAVRLFSLSPVGDVPLAVFFGSFIVALVLGKK